jgi:hypothetical protein
MEATWRREWSLEGGFMVFLRAGRKMGRGREVETRGFVEFGGAEAHTSVDAVVAAVDFLGVGEGFFVVLVEFGFAAQQFGTGFFDITAVTDVLQWATIRAR